MTPVRRHLPTLGLALLLALFAVRLLDTARVHSLTSDEPHYIATGLYLWDSGDYDFVESLRFHPPLAFHLASVPLLFAFSAEERAGWTLGPDLGLRLLQRGPPLTERLRFASRLPFVALAIWGAFLCFAWARDVAGPEAGLLATFLFTFSPLVLAHGALVHSDIASCVLALQALYALWRWLLQPSGLRLGLAGLALGLLAIAKLTSILVFAGIGLGFLGLAILRLRAGPEGAAHVLGQPLALGLGALVAHGAALFALVVLVIWASYGGSLALIESPFGYFPGVRLPSWIQSFLIIDNANTVSRPVYFFGEFSDEGWASFFPLAFAIKEPVGAVVLVLAAGFALGAGRWRTSPLAAFLAPVFAVVLGVIFLWLHVPLGLRYVLLLYPLGFVLSATLLLPAARRWQRVGVGAACAWIALSSGLAHPHYLSYFNELVGGSEQGHRYLLDANLDWGQDLPFLAEALDARGNPPVAHAIRAVERPRDYAIRGRPLRGCEPVTGWVAISVNVRLGLYSAHDPFAKPVPDCYAWLDDETPIAVPGNSIWLYEVR